MIMMMMMMVMQVSDQSICSWHQSDGKPAAADDLIPAKPFYLPVRATSNTR